MIIEIMTPAVIYNALCRNDFAESGLTHGNLRGINREIEERVMQVISNRRLVENATTYLNCSSNELQRTILDYPNIFAWEVPQGRKIVRAPNSEESYNSLEERQFWTSPYMIIDFNKSRLDKTRDSQIIQTSTSAVLEAIANYSPNTHLSYGLT